MAELLTHDLPKPIARLGHMRTLLEEWADGKPRSISRHTDFACAVSSLRAMMCRYGKSTGGRFVTKTVDDTTLHIQFFPDDSQ